MKNEHAPLLFREFTLDASAAIPIAIALVVGILLMFGVKRELATAALFLGLVSALLIS